MLKGDAESDFSFLFKALIKAERFIVPVESVRRLICAFSSETLLRLIMRFEPLNRKRLAVTVCASSSVSPFKS